MVYTHGLRSPTWIKNKNNVSVWLTYSYCNKKYVWWGQKVTSGLRRVHFLVKMCDLSIMHQRGISITQPIRVQFPKFKIHHTSYTLYNIFHKLDLMWEGNVGVKFVNIWSNGKGKLGFLLIFLWEWFILQNKWHLYIN